MQDPYVAESKCPWLSGWDPAGTLGLLNGPALGAGVSSGPAASPWGSPFPASACIHVQNYVLQVIPSAVVGLRTWAAWDQSLCFRVQGGWDMDVGSW